MKGILTRDRRPPKAATVILVFALAATALMMAIHVVIAIVRPGVDLLGPAMFARAFVGMFATFLVLLAVLTGVIELSRGWRHRWLIVIPGALAWALFYRFADIDRWFFGKPPQVLEPFWTSFAKGAGFLGLVYILHWHDRRRREHRA